VSVRLTVCYVCNVAKQYVFVLKNCLIKQIRLPDRYTMVPIQIAYDPDFPQTGVLSAPLYTFTFYLLLLQ